VDRTFQSQWCSLQKTRSRLRSVSVPLLRPFVDRSRAGAHAVVYINRVQFLWKIYEDLILGRPLYLTAYNYLQFTCGSTGFATGMLFDKMTFFDDRGDPGDADAFAL
jgi:hypothetical protein